MVSWPPPAPDTVMWHGGCDGGLSPEPGPVCEENTRVPVAVTTTRLQSCTPPPSGTVRARLVRLQASLCAAEKGARAFLPRMQRPHVLHGQVAAGAVPTRARVEGDGAQ